MMKKLLLILLCLPMIGFGQTVILDANFEAYLEANGMGDGIASNNTVFTSAIDTVTHLHVSSLNIVDLTGIEYFIALSVLYCDSNQLTILDVSNNTALTHLECNDNQLTSLIVGGATTLTYLHCLNNQLTSLDVSNNTALTYLNCLDNQLTSLDVSNNTALTSLWCLINSLTSIDLNNNTALILFGIDANQLTSLDVSNNTALQYLNCTYNGLTHLNVSQNTALISLRCDGNQLTTLDVRNGNNMNFSNFDATLNLSLTCIDVDNVAWSNNNWTNIDPQHYFSNNCISSTIQEHSSNKEILKVTDLLGRETKGTKNEVLFYIYDDGTVERRIIIE